MNQPERKTRQDAGGRIGAVDDPIGDRDKLRALAAELAIAEERERRRIAGGLHDQVGQLLGIAKVKLGEALDAASAAEAEEPLSKARSLVDQAIREIRTLTFELSSPVLQELGLEAALEGLAERMATRHGIPCRFERGRRRPALSEETAVLLLSIVRELLWNVAKHSRAREAKLAIGAEGARLRIVVEDDGVGFDATLAGDPVSDGGGLGLFGARERLAYLGGTLAVDSTPGRGSRVVLTVPNAP